MADTVFRRLFLDQLGLVISKEPSYEAIHELLQLATPDFDATKLNDEKYTKKCYRTLLARTHPDKHPQDVTRATKFAQDLPNFYAQCQKCPPKAAAAPSSSAAGAFSFGQPANSSSSGFNQGNTKRTPSPTSTAYLFLPNDFNASTKWPHIAYNVPYWEAYCHPSVISCRVAFQLINTRGAIAHGKAIGLVYDNKQSTSGDWTSVRDVLDASGGCKELTTIESIKEELMNHGPVVSTSFRPSPAFVSGNLHHFMSLQNQKDFLIVGWELSAYGEVWLVQPLYSYSTCSAVVPVAIGQFGIDDCCLAPKRTFEDRPWEHGPYFDISTKYMDTKWRTTWSGMTTTLDNFGQVESLFKSMGTVRFDGTCRSSSSGGEGLFGQNKCTLSVTVRDGKKHAHSRRGALESLEWCSDTGKWKAHVEFVILPQY